MRNTIFACTYAIVNWFIAIESAKLRNLQLVSVDCSSLWLFASKTLTTDTYEYRDTRKLINFKIKRKRMTTACMWNEKLLLPENHVAWQRLFEESLSRFERAIMKSKRFSLDSEKSESREWERDNLKTYDFDINGKSFDFQRQTNSSETEGKSALFLTIFSRQRCRWKWH